MRIEVENDAIRARKKQEYEELVAEMDVKGYEARLEKISVLFANIFGILVFVIVGGISACIYLFVNGNDSIQNFFGPMNHYLWMLIFFAVYVVAIFVHEFIHGFLWHFACEKKWGSIDFGFNARNLTPYCHCREALSTKVYCLGAIGPTIILGVIPVVISIFIQSWFLLSFGVVGVVGGCGDILVIISLIKHRDCLLFDHPYEVGYAYFVEKQKNQ